jgi:uncharacterized protein YyaL (SSP411 family)
MLLVIGRLYALTGKKVYLQRAETVYGGMESLRFADKSFYASPYSAKIQGAKTDEYSTLSSQNYLILGLLMLHENTGKAKYLDEVLVILRHIHERLYDAKEGRLLHHWIDGRAANKTDVDYFCSGCNLQVLYILWYLEHRLSVVLS